MDNYSSTDFDFEAEQLNNLASQQAWKLDHQLNVQFYKHAELNSAKSKVENRKVFEDKVYVRILIPANRLNVIEREATQEDRLRFAKQFQAFVERGEQLQNGSALDQLPFLTKAQILELRALKIETVEQLAGVPDTTVQLLGTGGMTLKQRAIQFLDERKSNSALAEQNRSLVEQIAELRAIVEKNTTATEKQAEVKIGPTVAV